MWKNMSLPVPASMKPKPLSVNRLIVPSAIRLRPLKKVKLRVARQTSSGDLNRAREIVTDGVRKSTLCSGSPKGPRFISKSCAGHGFESSKRTSCHNGPRAWSATFCEVPPYVRGLQSRCVLARNRLRTAGRNVCGSLTGSFKRVSWCLEHRPLQCSGPRDSRAITAMAGVAWGIALEYRRDEHSVLLRSPIVLTSILGERMASCLVFPASVVRA